MHWGFYVLIASMALSELATALGAGLFPMVFGEAAKPVPLDLLDLPPRHI